ncbi:MAG: LysR family transcriptional regulator [Candidatus Methylacidiphilales bacterium]
MNVHHLELFYHVARHGGITRACRHMPYSVGQPAVSAQILALERELGVTLFRRKPFLLTEAGRDLFAFAAPFFGGLDDIENHLRGNVASRLRLAGPTEVVRDHFPDLLRAMESSQPRLQIKLVEADFRLAAELLERAEIDLAVVVPEDQPVPGMRFRSLTRLPLILLAPSTFPPLAISRLLAAGASGKHRLIALPPHERLPRIFAAELRRRGLVWPVSIEASSNELVTRYVRAGLGLGLATANPGSSLPPDIRAIRLPSFPPLPIAALWKGTLPPLVSQFLSLLETRARSLAARSSNGKAME